MNIERKRPNTEVEEFSFIHLEKDTPAFNVQV